VQVLFAISRGAAACDENVFSKKPKSKQKKSKKQKFLEVLRSENACKNQETTKPGSCSPFHRFQPLPTHSHKQRTGRTNLLHLNSAPDEATTSIWLKAMMVCRELRGEQ
jgi:hypothetical protein